MTSGPGPARRLPRGLSGAGGRRRGTDGGTPDDGAPDSGTPGDAPAGRARARAFGLRTRLV
ncbi:two-component sensor histidine kinase, partial [Streptomyces sp. NPDC005009]